MPVNQPKIKEDPAESSWDLEVTQLINTLEQQIANLQQQVTALTARIQQLENN